MTHNLANSKPMTIGMKNQLVKNLSGPMEVQGQEAGIWLPVSRLQQLVAALPKTGECDFQRISPVVSSHDRSLIDLLQDTQLSSSAPSTSALKPPIGVFWDIENCQVPNGVSALTVVQLVREQFFHGFREEEFVVVCDVTKEHNQIIQELNAAQIDLVHVASICKNAADEKLRQALRRFADRHVPPAAVILLSGDINFASDLNDLKYRKQIRVILLHPRNTSEALIMCSDENYNFSELTQSLPHRSVKGSVSAPDAFDLLVKNLPDSQLLGPNKIKHRLRQLAYNCGGKIVHQGRVHALVRFTSYESASRARVRMDGEDVLGQKISVGNPQIARSASAGVEIKQVSSDSGSVSYPKVPLQSFPQGFLPHVPPPSTHQFKSAATSSFMPVNSSQGQSLAAVSEWFNHSLVPPPAILMPPPSFSQVLASGQSTKNQTKTVSPTMNLQSRASPFPVRADADGSETQSKSTSSDRPESPVELQISNLDFNLEMKEVRKSLLEAFREHVMVLNMSVFTQSDGQLGARVKVPTRKDAQVAIAALHRKKLGNRRVRITMPNQSRSGSISPSSQLIRDNVKSVLVDVPNLTMPLFKLCELYERRFLSSVSLSELNRMRDLVSITGNSSTGRTISLLPEARRSLTPSFVEMAEAALQSGRATELPYCPRHCKQSSQTGWAEKTLEPLPNIRMPLFELSAKIYQLLQSHNGLLPVFSLPACYEAEFGKLENYSHGVPLEHFVTWINGVILKSSPNGGCTKLLAWGTAPVQQCPVGSFDEPCNTEVALDRATSPAQLAAQLSLFGREVVELLRGSNHCQIPFTKFIPSYHHHFGRQCRVASYGFTRLIDLLEAIPTVIQVIGEGEGRVVILAQQAQVRRFTSDLIRILKAQAKRQAVLSELPDLFTKTFNKVFDPIDYGLCAIEDLVSVVSPNTIVYDPPALDGQLPSMNTILSLPKREQTAEESDRTRHFAKEVISLLRNAPQCAIPFNKFIPAYHHHFGRQCRLSDYGVTKLTELLSAVGDVVEIEEMSTGERRILLSLQERQSVLADQLRSLLLRNNGSMALEQLNTVYQHEHGIALDAEKYGATNIFDLVNNISPWLQVISTSSGPCVQIARNTLKSRVLFILMEQAGGSMKIDDLRSAFAKLYKSNLSISDLTTMEKQLILEKDMVTLTPLFQCASKLFAVIVEQGDSVPLNNLYNLYVVKMGNPLDTAAFGHSSVTSLLNALPEVFEVSGKANKRLVSIHQFLQDSKRNVGTPDAKLEVHPSLNNNVICKQAPRVSGRGDSEFGLITWGSLLPTPQIPPRSQLPFAHQSSMPWIGKPLGLHLNNYYKEESGVWPAAAINPMGMWSPPKVSRGMPSPDLNSLPLPTLDFACGGSDHPLDLSDSGIGHASPVSNKRTSRLAANFSNPMN